MACPPPLLEGLSKTLNVDKNKLTVVLNVETKSKKGPRIVITDLEMLDWLGSKGYNIEGVLKSGRVDNLLLKGNDPVWQFDVSKFPKRSTPPQKSQRSARPAKPRAKTSKK